MSGRFLVLDGPDGCGKSTQAAALADRMRAAGRTPLVLRDPGGTAVGDRIRAVLLDPDLAEMDVRAELLLYLASRAQLVAERVVPALEEGRDVVCDRYLTATVAYQGYAGGLDPQMIWQVGRQLTGGPDPDLCILLDLDAGESMRRVGEERDRMEARGVVFQEKVREGFRAAARDGPYRCVVVTAAGGVEAVTDRVWREVRGVL